MNNYNINNILTKMSKNKRYFELYVKQNPSYFLKEFIEKEKIIVDGEIIKDFNNKIEKHSNILSFIEREINVMNQFYGNVIGIKGYFLYKNYYPSDIKRYFNDIDFLANKKNIYKLYQFLTENGYEVKKDKFLYYDNALLFRTFKSAYMKSVHCLNMVKTIYDNGENFEICIDLHFDLNVGSESTFDMKHLWKSAIVKKDSFLEFSPYDYAAYLIYHLVKHLCFVNYYNIKLSIDIQKVWDIYFVIQKNNLDLFELKTIMSNYGLPHYYILFLKIYNDIFLHNEIPYHELLDDCHINFRWKAILEKILNMDIVDVLLGSYGNDIPNLEKMLKKIRTIKNQNIRNLVIRYYVNLINREKI